MRHLARLLALIAWVGLLGSIAEAGSARRHAKVVKKKQAKRKKVVPPIQEPIAIVEDEDDEEAEEPDEDERDEQDEQDEQDADDEVAVAEEDEADEIDTPVRVTKKTTAPRRDWHFAIGPYGWASNVEAKVTVGDATVTQAVDFIDLTKHTKFGAQVLAEARYRRLSVQADLTYAVIGLNGSKDIGPLMVTINGSASTIQADGFAGYRVFGSNQSLFAIEPRLGIRYQRTVVSGAIDVNGGGVAPPESIDAGSDGLLGGRVFVRPWRKVQFTANADIGVVGTSTATWSASADTTLQLKNRVLISLGWRTMMMDRAYVRMVMSGPRASVQVLF
jgi:hypothetical protein